MRFYQLSIIDPKTTKPPVDASGKAIGPFNTLKTPGRGLHIEFDVMITGLDEVGAGTALTIYGLPIDVLKQSVKLHGCIVSLIAGFSAGLPLANPAQQGEIIYGEVLAAYANWIGTNQTLSLIVNPAIRRNDEGKTVEISADAKKGEKLGDVLCRALQKAYPKKRIECTVSDALILPESGPLHYTEITSLATMVKSASIALMKRDNYSGVRISMQADTIRIFDNSDCNREDKKILPHELIGQPTWIQPFIMSFKCPLRGDLRVCDIINLPQGTVSDGESILMTNTHPNTGLTNQTTTFSGRFMIQSVRHIGAFLSASGDAWSTVFTATAIEQRSR
ncbi:hypothetical protein [Escherichia coli]|uniref:hypothetical protein n=1 Tax=Escherichia coli TaxID=562 RepID=UPI001918280E|nr:hypothetical protein [Escherichia coli]CAD6037295.1 Uncharacterised protein [Escherichia coli]CAD6099431.1 Uncharacterised protein [Escherichia coli]CAD6176076.1 Uncharacterised protein [Escherichia coli]